MIYNIGFLVGILIFTISGYLKGTGKTLYYIVTSVVALVIAVLTCDLLAGFLSKYVTILDLEKTIDVIIASEYVYFRTIAFLIIFFLSTLILNVAFKRFYDEERFTFDSKIAKINLGVLNGFFQMIILLSIALATPYALKYSNTISVGVSNVPGVGTAMNKVTYDYTEYTEILDENPNLDLASINIIVMEEMIDDGYTTKSRLNSVVKHSYWYSEEVEEWLTK